MWILHSGDDYVGGRAAAAKSKSAARRDYRFHGWQHLPLWNLSAHRECNSESREDEWGASRRQGGQPMSDQSSRNLPLEPERYELRAAAPYRFDLDRRDFFKFLGAGVIVVSVLKPAVIAQESGGRQRRGESLPNEIDAWLHISENGKVTVYTGKVEVGQNIRTSLSQAVAEELHVALANIEVVMGDTQLTPFDMGTFGSRTTPTMNLQLRKVAAAAREMLIGLAAAQ